MTTWHLAAENDYADLTPGEPVQRVAVVIPVYNRVELLARTVAGLVHQCFDGDLQVVVADDGSDEDVAAALRPMEGLLNITLVRREHEGYGAGQARNLGARTCDAEVVVFVDADCVPDPELVSRHAAWHSSAANLVVIGGRHPLDTTDVTVERLLGGALALRQLAGLPSEDDSSPSSAEDVAAFQPSDWRRLLYRRTARLRRGDEAYRSLVSSNFSVRRSVFLSVGGFDEEFERWGGEDTELGWRLAAAGCFFVPEDRAINYHQIQEDAGPEAWREDARSLNDGIIRAKIPHRFYRSRSRPGVVYQVPKVSVVAAPVPDVRAEPLVQDLLRQNLTDWHTTLIGNGVGLRILGEELRADPRFTMAPEEPDLSGALRRALEAARGEYVALVDGGAALDHRLLARSVRHLDRHHRDGRVSVGYRLRQGSDVVAYRRRDDASSLDGRYGPGPWPAFVLVRRRELSRCLARNVDAQETWALLQQITQPAHLSQALVGLPIPPDGEPPSFRSTRSVVVEDLKRSRSPAVAVRVAVRAVRGRGDTATGASVDAGPAVQPGPLSAPDPIPVRYVGWVGHDNFGDEVLLRAIRDLLPWASLETSGDPQRCVLLGGGTLINRGYLKQLERMDSPRIERAVFGTGVANPEYWGAPREDPQAWVDYLSTCALVGIRGPISEQLLRGWGYRGPLTVIGDPALAVRCPDVQRQDGRIVVSLAQTRGELWGDDDQQVFDAIAPAVRRWLADGRDVQLMSASPRDDLASFELARAAGAPDLPHVAGYRDLDEAVELLASADVVVGERLHAVVLAAACATPFVALEYRPKLRDFAQSVGAADQVIRTDQLDTEGLVRAVADTERRADELRQQVAERVELYRSRLETAAEALREELV